MKKGEFLLFATIFLILILINFASAVEITNCSVLNSAGNYYLQNDISYTSMLTCFALNSSDIYFNCQNHYIQADGVNGIYGFAETVALSNITIKNCNITSFDENIHIEYVDGLTIDNCTIDSELRGTSKGITIGYSDNATIKNCKILSSNSEALRITHSRGIEAYNNEITGSSWAMTIKGMNNSAIHDNSFYTLSGGGYALRIEGETSNNNIFYRNILNDTYAFILLDGRYFENNLFYDNIMGGVFAFSGSMPNFFNTTLSSGENILGGNLIGGNYWNNLSHTDSNGDGIADNPHYILPNMTDYLPLTYNFTQYNNLPIIITITLSETSYCIPPNTTLIIEINAMDEENDTIGYAHKCTDLGNMSSFNSTSKRECFYEAMEVNGLTIYVNDTLHTDWEYYRVPIRITNEGCVKGMYDEATPLPVELVNIENINQGMLPSLYFGVVSFIENLFAPAIILFVVLIGIFLMIAVGTIIGKIAGFGR